MSGWKIISQHRVESPDYTLVVYRSRMFIVYIAMHFKSRTFYTSCHFWMTVEETPPLFTLHLNQLSVGSAPLATWVFLMWNIWAGDRSFLWLLIYCQSGKVYEIWKWISMTEENWVCLDWCNCNVDVIFILSSKHGKVLSLYSANTNSRSESITDPYLNMMRHSIVPNVSLLEIKACEQIKDIISRLFGHFYQQEPLMLYLSFHCTVVESSSGWECVLSDGVLSTALSWSLRSLSIAICLPWLILFEKVHWRLRMKKL